jgi:hypothetical protein
MSLTLGRFVEFPRAAPSGIPQTSLGFRGHLITNFPHIMVLLIIISTISLTAEIPDPWVQDKHIDFHVLGRPGFSSVVIG